MNTIIYPNTKVIIFCGPSGSGKTTLARMMLVLFPRLSFSTSATTRKIRAKEKEGVDYFFMTREEFLERVRNGEFLEYEENHGEFYGTLASEVAQLGHEGKIVVFDVDVRGALNLKKKFGKNALSIFVHVPLPVLRERLHLRATETEDEIKRRLETAVQEQMYAKNQLIDHVIENMVLEDAAKETKGIVFSFLSETA
ncbi:MAG: guanylate kinase [Candidatus Pacebacteria bacterium]|jgi:guanylate kinase|nr:guanylate kinase [Candidatus Paceibacterota bacterium]